ncbi:hypothetical protein ACJX0J_038091, partial [Zea mays]
MYFAEEYELDDGVTMIVRHSTLRWNFFKKITRSGRIILKYDISKNNNFTIIFVL